MRRSTLQCSALIAACLLLTGCARREIFLIDNGYQGPVVVIFGCRGGESLNPADLQVEYRIGSDGILLVEAESPPGAWVDQEFYWVLPDGTRAKLPDGDLHGQPKGEVQAFRFVVGGRSATARGGRGYFTFLVGERGQRLLLVEQLEALKERATALCLPTESPKSSEG